MSDYKIVTDSTSDLPFDVLQDLDIGVVQLSYRICGKNFKDYVGNKRTQFLSEFYENLKNGEISQTSQLNPSQIVEFFEKFLKKGLDIIYIAFSSGLSGTYSSATIAYNELVEKFPERKIKIIDSKCASLGEGLLVYEAVLNKKSGMNIDELENWIENNKMNICHWVVMDDLKHLRRGGRISGSSAFFGSLLNVKPIVYLSDDGKLVMATKKRGRKTAVNFLIEQMKNIAFTPIDKVFISHSQREEESYEISNILKKEFNLKTVIISEIGTVIGSYTGVGTISIFFRGKQRSIL